MLDSSVIQVQLQNNARPPVFHPSKRTVRQWTLGKIVLAGRNTANTLCPLDRNVRPSY